MRILVSILFLLLLSNISFSQSHNTTLGIRLADDYGFTATQRILNHTCIEIGHQDGLFSGKQRSTFLIKQHTPLITRRLNFFIGAGIHHTINKNSAVDAPFYKSTGAAFTLGTEFTLGRLNLAIDMSPTYLLNKGGRARFESSSGLSLRYVIWKRKSQLSTFFSKLKFW